MVEQNRRILIVVDRFVDCPGATPLLVHKIVSNLSKRGYDISILSTKVISPGMPREKSDSKLFELENFHYFAKLMAGKGIESRRIVDTSGKIIKVIDWSRSQISDWDYTDTFYSNRFVDLAKRAVLSNKCDLIISFSHPFSCHRLASRVKKIGRASCRERV